MPNELEGQVAVVTGAAAGLGFAIATKLSAQGAVYCLRP
jgi:NAD(P)-dependent dehydrogenase (short-subunit alcohol dehydrogenase family)